MPKKRMCRIHLRQQNQDKKASIKFIIVLDASQIKRISFKMITYVSYWSFRCMEKKLTFTLDQHLLILSSLMYYKPYQTIKCIDPDTFQRVYTKLVRTNKAETICTF